MPELPEVETICRTLGPLVVGRRIEHCDIWLSRLIKTPATEFGRRIEGRQVQRLRRRGKYLLLELEEDVLVIHLRMTRRLEYRTASETARKSNSCFHDPPALKNIWYKTDYQVLNDKS